MTEPVAASATRVGAAFDLVAAYAPPDGHLVAHRGMGVAGGSPATTLDASSPASVLAALRAFRAERTPVAAGALPFDPSAPASLDVAASAVVRVDDDGPWRVDVGDPARTSKAIASAATQPTTTRPTTTRPTTTRPGPSASVGAGTPAEAFEVPQLRWTPSPEDYADAVRRATGLIAAGDLRKVVLARTIEVDAGRALDPRRLARRLRAVDPDAFVFAVPSGDGVLVGASPELLVGRHGRIVRSNPLAGSAARSGDPDEDRALAEALAGSTKEREEHALVVDAVAEVLGPACDALRWDPEPVLLETANVWHLSTRFEGILREPAPSSLELVRELHPTPAVGGAPPAAALETIANLEPFDRGRYAGPVGWIDAAGDGEWAIALRCAELRGDRAVLYAGAGIVRESEPMAEVAETERKFRAFLDALRWG